MLSHQSMVLLVYTVELLNFLQLKKRWHLVIRHPISRGSTVGCSTLLLNREGDDLVTLIHNVLHAIMDLAKLKTLDRISS